MWLPVRRTPFVECLGTGRGRWLGRRHPRKGRRVKGVAVLVVVLVLLLELELVLGQGLELA